MPTRSIVGESLRKQLFDEQPTLGCGASGCCLSSALVGSIILGSRMGLNTELEDIMVHRNPVLQAQVLPFHNTDSDVSAFCGWR